MKTIALFSFGLPLASLLLGAGCSSTPADLANVDDVTQAASATGQYTYAFDKTGLTTSIGSAASAYSITRAGDTLQAGTTAYRYDALGRVTTAGDVTMIIGPTGNVARATRGATTIAYVYDENGDRILKSTGGVPTAAYVDGLYVSPSELIEPVRVGERLVGVLRNDRFAMAPTDARGTVQGDLDGTSRIDSPFGARPVHPDLAAAVDYAAKGFDADLGVVRMGVRDYDARTNRFLAPDPLYLEHPEKCIEHGADCNLYTYARNNPASFVDPTGKDGIAIGPSLSIGGGTGGTHRGGVSIDSGGFVSFGKGGMGMGTGRLPWMPTLKFWTWDWRHVQIREYVSIGTVSMKDKGNVGVGASAGGSISATMIRDDDAFWGKGQSAQISTPLPVGGQLAYTSDGKLNGGGLSYSPTGMGRGASRTVSTTTTYDITALKVRAITAVVNWFKGK